MALVCSITGLFHMLNKITATYSISVIELQNGLGWKGPYRSSCSKPPAMGRDTFH